MSAEERQPLAERVLEGGNPQLQMMAAQGLVPLPPEELVPLQVALTRIGEAEIAKTAADALAQLDPKIVARVLEDDSRPEVLTYFGRHSQHPLIKETVLRRRRVPRELLVEMATTLSSDLQEILLFRQDAILDEPAILDALEKNPQLSAWAQGRIEDYRLHLLPRGEAARAGVEEGVGPEEVQDAIEEARKLPAEGEVERVTGLSESQLRNLPIQVRLKLSRGAARSLRNALVRDQNPQVAVSALQHNSFAESEVVQLVNSRAIAGEVLDAIGRSRQWLRKYGIVVGLVKNPRSPTGLAVRLTSRLAVRDLQAVARDHNVPEAVRSTARRLYTIKSR